jgi:hypothetical protein
MKPVRIAVLLAAVLALGVCSLSAQPVISAKSGVIAYVEGKVFLGDQPLEYSVTKFPDIKENGVVRTEDGRAEILLTPGVMLRLGENSSLKVLSNRLIDTRLDLLAGSAVVEADAVAKDNNVTIACKNGAVTLSKAGIYRFDAAPGSVKVFKGQADVQMSGETTPVPVGASRMAMLDSTAASVQKFNSEETDALDHWSRRRGEYVALANVSAAKSLLDSGNYSPTLGIGGVGLGMGMGMNGCLNSWAFNQWYGMYTYMPFRGYLNSPYGYQFWSPYTVMRAYVPGGYYGGGNRGLGSGLAAGAGARSYPTVSPTSTGYSGVMSRAGSYGGASAGGGGHAGGGGGVSAAGGGEVSSAGGAGGGGHGGSSGGGGGHH